MIRVLEALAERRIAEAIERGDLDGLPGEGAPLRLDDDALVPEAVRIAYRVLRNAGYVPEEIRGRREIAELESGLRELAPGPSRAAALRRLHWLRLRLRLRGRATSAALDEPRYRERLLARLEERG